MKMQYFNRVVSAIVLALSTFTASAQAGVIMSTPDLPPIGNDVFGLPTGYLSPSDVHALYSRPMLTVILKNVIHQPRVLLGTGVDGAGNHTETFQSTLDALASINSAPFVPIHAEGPVMTLVRYMGVGPTGTFDTEMLSLDLMGMGFMIRENQMQQSIGTTVVTDLGAGQFHIDSFFDVFTELSVDGGATWIPNSLGPTRVELSSVPEPGTMGLLICGASGLVWYRLRRRS